MVRLAHRGRRVGPFSRSGAAASERSATAEMSAWGESHLCGGNGPTAADPVGNPAAPLGSVPLSRCPAVPLALTRFVA
jgi:hypothetical protein